MPEWPGSFDVEVFGRKSRECERLFRDVTDVWRVGPRGSRIWDIERGGELRERYFEMAGEHRV